MKLERTHDQFAERLDDAENLGESTSWAFS